MKQDVIIITVLLSSFLISCGTVDTIDRIPPEVTVLEPENDEIGAPITVTVNATDNDAVTGVSLYIDGVFLDRKTTPPYAFYWYSDYWGDGKKHLLSATAADPTGNVGMSKAVTVDVMKTTKPAVDVIRPHHNAVFAQPRVTLQWKPIENTKTYAVQVSDTISMDLISFDTLTSETSLTFQALQEKTYRWRVLPTTIGNIFGGWSKEHVFHRTGQFTSIIGTKKFDALNSIARTNDGGLLLAGSSHSLQEGGMLVKIGASGHVQWERFFGGFAMSWFSTAVELQDGGFLAAGQNVSKELLSDQWLIKTDRTGELLMTKSIIETGAQGVSDILPTKDGGAIVCSFSDTDSNGVDVILTKYDAELETIWKRKIGGPLYDEAFDIAATSDGGMLIAGVSQRGTNLSSEVAVAIRTNFLGEEKWRNEMRSDGGARFFAGIEHNKNYYFCGTTRSSDHQQDALVAAFDSTGSPLWTKTFGTFRDDAATGITVINNTIAVCGSYAADSLGIQDAWLLMLQEDGSEIFQKQYGGRSYDGATGITTFLQGLAIVGSTASFSSGSSDGFLIITDSNGNVLQFPP